MFDPLLFELLRTDVAQGGVTAPAVIKHLEILKDVSSRFSLGVVVTAMYQFHLERGEEAFHHRIVQTIAWPTHGALDAEGRQPLLIRALTALTVALFSFVVTYLILKLVDRVVGLRISSDEERMGLDLSQHNERAYS